MEETQIEMFENIENFVSFIDEKKKKIKKNPAAMGLVLAVVVAVVCVRVCVCVCVCRRVVRIKNNVCVG